MSQTAQLLPYESRHAVGTSIDNYDFYQDQLPLVRISLREGKSEEYKRALADGVHQALVEAIEIPAQDRFQVVTEHPQAGLIYDPSYLGIDRTDEIVLVQITLSTGRSQPAAQSTGEILVEKPGVDAGLDVQPGRSGLGELVVRKPEKVTTEVKRLLRQALSRDGGRFRALHRDDVLSFAPIRISA